MKTARYQIVSDNDHRLIIRDIGPWDEHPTVTNDADGVVQRLYAYHLLWDGKRLYYYDSDGRLDEIVHGPAGFIRFQAIGETVEFDF